MRHFFRKTIYFLIIIVIGIAGFDFIRTNYWSIATAIPKEQRRQLKFAFNSIRNLPFLHYQFLPLKLATYELFIGDKDLQKMVKDLPADENTRFDADKADFVDAKFKGLGQEYKVKIKYRGSTSQHWAYPKKSVRVNFVEPQFFQGMSEINLVVPESRGWLVEALNNYRAKKIGLPYLKDDFINLKINDESYGVYYLFEGWTKEFLERDNKLTADTNLYGEKDFNDNLYKEINAWTKYVSNPYEDKKDTHDLQKFLKIVNEPNNTKFYSELETILDLDNFFKWNAHAFLAGSFHQDFKHNARIYFDPTIGKFKFIPWQVLGWPIEELGDITYNPLVRRSLANEEWLARRNQILWQYVSNAENLKVDLAFYDELTRRVKRDVLQDRKKQESNRVVLQKIVGYKRTIESNFNFLKDKYFDTVLEQVSGSGDGNYITAIFDIQARGPAQLSVFKARIQATSSNKEADLLFYADTNRNGLFDQDDKLIGKTKMAGDGPHELIFIEPPEITPRIEFDYDEASRRSSLIFAPNTLKIFLLSEKRAVVNYKNLKVIFEAKNSITGEVVEAINKDYLDEGVYYQTRLDKIVDNNRREFWNNYPQFRRGVDNSAILEAGTYYFFKTVIVPKELNLVIKPGVNVFMGKNASFVAYGGISLEGTPANYIYFHSADSEPWGIFAVIDTDKPANIAYTIFDGGGGTKEFTIINGARFTGMVAVHGAPETQITASKFLNSRGGDDALNIKYGKVKIVNSEFRGNKFDALDLDFVQGEVVDNKFINNINDGIDISGSSVLIKDNYIERSGDKGISVGENSKPEIVDNVIVRGNIGVAVKDLSEAKLIRNTIFGNKVGLAAYEKKPFFGGGRAEISGSVIWKNERLFEIDSNSSVSVINSNIEGGYLGTGNYSKDPELSY